MSLDRFVRVLLETGVGNVPAVEKRDGVFAPIKDVEEAEETLADFEQNYRLDLPGQAPAFDRAAAAWGAMVVCRFCQLLAYRDIGAKEADSLVPTDGPAMNPTVAYSVDLTMRFAPDVVRLARAVNPADPLIEKIVATASRWPLSSVGIEGATASLDGWGDDDCLFALYIDRVVAARDVSRLDNERVRARVRVAIGDRKEIAPEIAAALEIR